jgi:uncharacterized protein (DUF1778 family)
MIRRKPKAERKESQIRVLVTTTQKQLITEAARNAGLNVATWVRSVAVKKASGT